LDIHICFVNKISNVELVNEEEKKKESVYHKTHNSMIILVKYFKQVFILKHIFYWI